MPRSFLVLFLLLIHGIASGQGIGAWQFHSAYANTKTVAKTGATVYVAGDYSAYTYEADGGELDDFTRLDGLSDNAYSKFAYNEAERTLVIGYSTGNIDLVKDGKVINIPALLNANILGSRRINHIAFRGSLAYLSCDFGLVVLDVGRQEIRASNTNLDATSANSPVSVRAADASGDRLFLATSQGVKAIGLNSNLMDTRLYTHWQGGQGASGLPGTLDNLVSVFRFGRKMYAAFRAPNSFYFLADDSRWYPTDSFPTGDLQSITVKGEQLLACVDNKVYWKRDASDPGTYLQDTLLVDPVEAVFGDGGTLYVADRATGLTVINTSATPIDYTAVRPNGPAMDLPFKLYAKGSRLYALAGGYENSNYGPVGSKGGFSVLENGFWSNYNEFNKNLPVGVTDLVNAYEFNNNLYLSSYGNGVLVRPLNDSSYSFYSDTAGLPNSLVSAIPNNPGAFGKYVQVTDVKADSRGQLWVANHFTDVLLHRWNNQGWTGFTFGPGNRANGVELLIDEFDVKWIRMAPEGARSAAGSVLAFKESANGNEDAVIGTSKGSGNLPNSGVYDFAFDKDGILWLGTGAGLAALYSPYSILSGEPFDVTLPIFDGRPLLENDIVTAIAIDGGNRKWVGTRNSGVWLFDKDVTKLLANYTFENSPLPSNSITDLAIAGESGQLFIATERGLVSFRIDATEALNEPTNSCVRIFPNPVRPNFEGVIGIECLPENAVVKITDQANRLVFETRANGGTATWNGKNYNGRKAAPGLYYVYAVTQGQRAGVVGKIAIIR